MQYAPTSQEETSNLKISSKSVLENLSRLRESLSGNSICERVRRRRAAVAIGAVQRHQMEQHGKVLAGSHKLGPDHAPEQLLTRLAENEGVLLDVRHLITEAVKAQPQDYAGRGMAA